jgi:membrane protein YqaA with SNARE-associated domain
MAIACAWGFAEATLLFIVPDVWLSYLALTDLKRALRASLWTLGGALAGGAAMYEWSIVDREQALVAVQHLPAIGGAMLEESGAMLREEGVWALFPGMLRGMPYKTFAVQAPHADIGLWLLLAVTVPARLARFALVSVATHFVAQRALGRWSRRAHVIMLTVAWAGFYAVYFTLHRGAH